MRRPATYCHLAAGEDLGRRTEQAKVHPSHLKACIQLAPPLASLLYCSPTPTEGTSMLPSLLFPFSSALYCSGAFPLGSSTTRSRSVPTQVRPISHGAPGGVLHPQSAGTDWHRKSTIVEGVRCRNCLKGSELGRVQGSCFPKSLKVPGHNDEPRGLVFFWYPPSPKNKLSSQHPVRSHECPHQAWCPSFWISWHRPLRQQLQSRRRKWQRHRGVDVQFGEGEAS